MQLLEPPRSFTPLYHSLLDFSSLLPYLGYSQRWARSERLGERDRRKPLIIVVAVLSFLFISTVSHFSPAKKEWKKQSGKLREPLCQLSLSSPQDYRLHSSTQALSSLCLRHFSFSLLSTSTLFSSPLSYKGPHILPSYSFSSLRILYNLTYSPSIVLIPTSSWPVLRYVSGPSHSSSFCPAITSRSNWT
jgi:hypothetical protein